MKKNIVLIILLVSLISCSDRNSKPATEKEKITQTNHQRDTLQKANTEVVYDNYRENLKFSIADTIKKSNLYFFSNSDSKDLFQLTIEPGEVKNSKAKLQIITADKKIIYTQSFDAFYFLRGIDEPRTIPAGNQEDHEKYIEKHRNALTQKQYQIYFKNRIDAFFNEIYPIEDSRDEYFKDWEEDINDKAFLNEVLADTTIKVIDITCFDCDEGGAMIGYSKKQNKVVTLIDHD